MWLSIQNTTTIVYADQIPKGPEAKRIREQKSSVRRYRTMQELLLDKLSLEKLIFYTTTSKKRSFLNCQSLIPKFTLKHLFRKSLKYGQIYCGPSGSVIQDVDRYYSSLDFCQVRWSQFCPLSNLLRWPATLKNFLIPVEIIIKSHITDSKQRQYKSYEFRTKP